MNWDANKIQADVHIGVNLISESIGHQMIDQVRAIAERPDVQELSRVTEVPAHLMALRVMSHALGHVVSACPGIEPPEVDRCCDLMKMTAEAFR